MAFDGVNDDDDEDYFGDMMAHQLIADEDLDDPASSSHPPAIPHNATSTALLSKPLSYFTPRPVHGVVGLDNQGATCYLNSLLQALYLTPEFRAALYDLDEVELGVAAYEEEQRAKMHRDDVEHNGVPQQNGAGSHKAAQQDEEEQKEVAEQPYEEPSDHDIYELVSMGFDEDRVRQALRKFPSLDQREQAIDFILTAPAASEPAAPPHPPTASSSQSSAGHSRAYRRIPIAFRLFFSQLQLYNHSSLPTSLITSAFGWTNANIGTQHDIHELYTRLCEAMDGSLHGITTGAGLVSSTFAGEVRRTLQCEGCGSRRERKEEFYSLHLPVRGNRSIHHALRGVFEQERLQLGCDVCGGKRSTVSSSCIDRFPFLLTFALGRHEYDRAKGARMKVGDDFAFPLTLDMAIYRADVDHHVKLGREKLLMAAVPLPNDDERNGKRKQPAGLGEDAAERDLLPSVYEDGSDCLYDLFAVVVHAGSAHSGHYFAYIRDVLREAEERQTVAAAGWKVGADAPAWWKCNDSSVSAMEVSLIASQYGGKKESAYMLMYRRRTLASLHPALPVVPPALAAAAEEYNAALEEERARWDDFRHAMKLVVWLDKAVTRIGDNVLELNRDGTASSTGAVQPNAAPKEEAADRAANRGRSRGKKAKQPHDAHAEAKEKTAKQRRQEEQEAQLESQRKARELQMPEDERRRDEEDTTGKYTFVVDERTAVEELYSGIRERLRWRDDERGGQLRLNRAERTEHGKDDVGRRLEGSLPFAGMVERDEEKEPDDDLLLEQGDGRGQSLAQLGLRHGDVLLAWNGHSLNGQPFFTGIKRPKRLRLLVRWVKDEDGKDTVVEFAIALPADAKVDDMVGLLRRRVGNDGDLQLFLMTKRALTSIHLSHPQVKLADMDISGSSTLVLELRSAASASSSSLPSRANSYFLSQSSRVKLVVQDTLIAPTAAASERERILWVDKALTIRHLKQQLLSSHPDVAADYCRLRRMTGTDRVGGPLVDLDVTLLAAGLDDDDVMVRLEAGVLPTAQQLDLVVSFIDDGGPEQVALLDQRPLLFERRWTVKQCKQAVLDSCGDGRAESQFVLFRGDAAGVAKDKLLSNEYVTLDRLNLHHGDSIFLHVGVLPIQGKITLDIFLFTPSLDALSLSSSSSASSLRAVLRNYTSHGEEKYSAEQQQQQQEEKTVAAASMSPTSTLHLPTRSSLLTHLVSLDFSSAASLFELKTALHSLPLLFSLPSPSHLRIRTLNKADELHNIIADDSAALKRQGIATDRRLAVQVLPAPETAVGASALLLRAVLVLPRRRDEAGGEGDDVVLMPVPAVELLFNASLHPQASELREWAGNELGVGAQGVVLLKWMSAEKAWKVLRDTAQPAAIKADTEQSSQQQQQQLPAGLGKRAGKQLRPGAVDSLLTVPYHLHQHDLIGVVPVSLLSCSACGAELDSHVAALCVNWPSPVVRSAEGSGLMADERKMARRDKQQREEIELTIDY